MLETKCKKHFILSPFLYLTTISWEINYKRDKVRRGRKGWEIGQIV